MKMFEKRFKQVEKEKVIMLTALAVVFFTSVSIPYFNIYISPLLITIVVYILAMKVLNLSSKINFLIGLIILFATIPWLIVGSRIKVEDFAILSFTLFAIGTVQQILDFRK